MTEASWLSADDMGGGLVSEYRTRDTHQSRHQTLPANRRRGRTAGFIGDVDLTCLIQTVTLFVDIAIQDDLVERRLSQMIDHL